VIGDALPASSQLGQFGGKGTKKQIPLARYVVMDCSILSSSKTTPTVLGASSSDVSQRTRGGFKHSREQEEILPGGGQVRHIGI